MKELNFKANVENVVTLASGTTVVKLKSDAQDGAPSEVGLTFPKQLIFETGEYEVTLKKVEPEAEAVEVEEERE